MTDTDQPTLSSANRSSDPPPTQPQSKAEWISLGLSSLILAIVIGLVVYLWVSDRKRQPPIIEVTTAEIRKSAAQYYVPFTVTNAGGETAEAVQVIAELRAGSTVMETGEQTIDFLSSQEKAEGAFIFTQDPRQAELIIRVASYSNP
jgi:uncharacterized protein (TIGR02588 family)